MTLTFEIRKSLNRPSKKYRITNNYNNDVIYIGDSAYQDFTQHGDESRKVNYLRRHQPKQDWTRSGIYTAGFWARWLLWNQPTLEDSKFDIEKKFKIVVKLVK